MCISRNYSFYFGVDMEFVINVFYMFSYGTVANKKDISDLLIGKTLYQLL